MLEISLYVRLTFKGGQLTNRAGFTYNLVHGHVLIHVTKFTLLLTLKT